MEKTEVWKSLDFMGYPDYEVSTLGRVKSLNYRKTGKKKILKQDKIRGGYLRVTLCNNKKYKHFRVHKLVALAYISNPYNLPQINHKDENKENNKVENLEFCSARYNVNYGTRNERLSKTKKGKPKTEEHKQKISQTKKGKPNYKQRKPILQYTKDNIFIREWDSATTASKELNICRENITNCCNGKYKTCSGFIWKYK